MTVILYYTLGTEVEWIELNLNRAEWRLFILIIFMLRVSATTHFGIINLGS